jgi:hypothetical protein
MGKYKYKRGGELLPKRVLQLEEAYVVKWERRERGKKKTKQKKLSGAGASASAREKETRQQVGVWRI